MTWLGWLLQKLKAETVLGPSWRGFVFLIPAREGGEWASCFLRSRVGALPTEPIRPGEQDLDHECVPWNVLLPQVFSRRKQR